MPAPRPRCAPDTCQFRDVVSRRDQHAEAAFVAGFHLLEEFAKRQDRPRTFRRASPSTGSGPGIILVTKPVSFQIFVMRQFFLIRVLSQAAAWRTARKTRP